MKNSVNSVRARMSCQIPKMDKLILSELKGEKEIQKFIRKTFRNKEIWTPCDVKFVRKETAFDEAWITNANYIWIQTNAISHSMYGKIMSVAKRCHKNVSYFKHSGAKSCLNQIVQKCESQNGET